MEKCTRCGGRLEQGYTDALGRAGRDPKGRPGLIFVMPGEPTSANLLEAFRQGLEGDVDQVYWIEGYRCCSCGGIELYAREPAA